MEEEMAEAQKEMAEESERNKEQWISVASSRSKVSLRISISPCLRYFTSSPHFFHSSLFFFPY